MEMLNTVLVLIGGESGTSSSGLPAVADQLPLASLPRVCSAEWGQNDK